MSAGDKRHIGSALSAGDKRHIGSALSAGDRRHIGSALSAGNKRHIGAALNVNDKRHIGAALSSGEQKHDNFEKQDYDHFKNDLAQRLYEYVLNLDDESDFKENLKLLAEMSHNGQED